jgi:hypothetical protein
MSARPSNTFVAPPHSVTVQGAYEPFELQVARNQIMGHEHIDLFGINSAVGTTFETVWYSGGTYAYPAAAAVLKVSSTSANDAAAGTGARTILVEGLDANYVTASETVILNGQTQVDTIKSYIRVNRLTVLTAGSGGVAAGVIYIGTGSATGGVPQTSILNAANTSNNKSESAVYTVPAGYTAYIYNYVISSSNPDANTATTFRLRLRPFNGIFNTDSYLAVPGNGIFELGDEFPNQVLEKSDIEVQAAATSGSSSASTQLQILLVKNDCQVA